MGVPEARIIVEDQSQNTGDNFKYAAQVLRSRGLEFQSFLVAQKPYMERRAYATGKQQWPNKELTITSPPTTYAQYMSGELPKDDIINIMVGDLQRIIEYPRLGFQITQEVPEEVMGAYVQLVRLGYTRHLIQS